MATYITPALVSYSSYHCSNGEYALDGNLTTRCSSNFMVSSRVDIELETSGYEVSEIKIYTENVDKVTVYDRTNNGWSWLTANTNITDGWNIVTIPTSLNYDWIDVRAESSDDTTYSYVYEIELGVENVATPTINNYPTNFDISLEQPAIFEIGKVTLDHNYTTLNFNGSYTNPVVVGQAVYVNDQNPKSIRVRNVTSTSCEIKLHNPSGLAITAEECFYMVAEEGIHEIDTGTFMEVGKVNVVDHIGKNDTLNDTYSNISLNHSWTTPVVFGQVMTENSVDWVEEKIINISSTSFDLSLENAESHLHSIAEDVGYIVFESNLNVVINGVRIQTGNTSNTISGYGNNSGVGENFTFPTVFSKNPLMIVEDRTRNGADGGWLVLIGNPTTTSFNVILDEDMIGDTERNHTTEEG